MKLQQKTTLFFLIPGVILILISGIFQYYLVNNKIHNRIDKQLLKEKNLINKQLKDLEDSKDLHLYKTLKSEIEIKEDFTPKFLNDKFYISEVYDKDLDEQIQVKILEFKTIIDNQTYIVKVKKPLEESQTFISGLVWANILLFSLLVIIYLVFNRIISKKIWTPFYVTLEALKEFNISRPEPLKLVPSNIEEFNRLNTEVDFLIKKVSRDYNNYKSFIENVSHELQTPLAVAKAKLDNLVQSENIKEEEHQILSKLTFNLNKLTRLNQSLVFLLKIENNLFSNKDNINLNQLVSQSLENFEDIIEIKEIKLKVKNNAPCSFFCNDILAEVLIDNLIKNAVKHNIQGGFLEIEILPNKLIIKNSGKPLNCKPEFMFERFRKNSDSQDSTGLGLSIVYQICTSNNFLIKYSNTGTNHTIEIKF